MSIVSTFLRNTANRRQAEDSVFDHSLLERYRAELTRREYTAECRTLVLDGIAVPLHQQKMTVEEIRRLRNDTKKESTATS